MINIYWGKTYVWCHKLAQRISFDVVESLVYLGCSVFMDGSFNLEIKLRIGKGSVVLESLEDNSVIRQVLETAHQTLYLWCLHHPFLVIFVWDMDSIRATHQNAWKNSSDVFKKGRKRLVVSAWKIVPWVTFGLTMSSVLTVSVFKNDCFISNKCSVSVSSRNLEEVLNYRQSSLIVLYAKLN